MASWAFLAAYCIIFVVIIYKSKFFSLKYLSKYYVYAFLCIHLLFAGGFYGVYRYHYPQGMDSEATYHSGERLYNMAFTQPQDFCHIMIGCRDSATTAIGLSLNKSWVKPYEQNVINENRTVIKVHALLHSISGHSYGVHLLMMVMLTLWGGFFLLRFFNPANIKEEKACVLACFFIPSFLFWTSGVLKEPLFFFCMAVYLYYLQQSLLHPSWRSIIWVIVAAAGMIVCRMFMSIILLACSLVYIWCSLRPQHTAYKYAGCVALGVLLMALTHCFMPDSGIDIVSHIANKNEQFINMETIIGSGLNMPVPQVKNSTISVIYNAPQALYNTLMIPCKQHTALHIGIFMENIFLALLLFISLSIVIFHHYSYSAKQWLLIWCCLIVFITIGLTTANAGAICRYRSVLLPLWTYILCLPLCKPKTVVE